MIEPVSFGLMATLIAPFLQKGAEKIGEETVELLFKSRKDIAEKFKNLFRPEEIISLKLNESDTPAEIIQKLDAKPEIKTDFEKKIADNQDLLKELIEALKQMPQANTGGITINAEKIGQVINNPTGPITITSTF